MNVKSLTALAVLSVGLCLTAANAADPAPSPARQAAVDRLHMEFPDVQFNVTGARITQVFGTAFGFGESPEAVAEQFVQSHAGLFGVSAAELDPRSLLEDERHTLPLGYLRDADTYKFTLVYYTQYRDGVPVYRADLRLLVRNDLNFPLVLANSALRDLGGFHVPAGADANGEAGRAAALALYPNLVSFTEPRLVIWAGVDDMEVAPVLALEFVGESADPFAPGYQKRLFLTDAATGAIVHEENLVLHTDVVGNVSGMGSQGAGAAVCVPEVLKPMPYARVNIGTTQVFADANGNYTIPNPGTAAVTVDSPIRGRRFVVNNQAPPNTVLSQTVTPPGPANFVHNQANTSEFNLAEVNGYIEANVVRDYTLAFHPTYPTIAGQTEFPVNVNIGSTCNAFYNGSSINFYRAGGGCANTAFSDVVHHEYGHHLVAVAGSGQGAYGEGMGDVMGVLILDESRTGIGFQNCSNGIRNANNTCQYQTSGCSSCGSEIHACGQLISGCVWSTRTNLLATNPGIYRDIISFLAINSMPLHTGSSITPTITVDYLTLDDNDGNLGNGTPHYAEINGGFTAHNMPGPPLALITFQYPNGRPDRVNPNTPTVLRVNVVAVNGTPVPGTGVLFHSVGGAPFTSTPMNQIATNQYEATLPAAPCGETIRYYVRATAVGGTSQFDPPGAPTASYSAHAETGVVTVLSMNFETSPGWTTEVLGATSGFWERGVPVNDPSWAYDPTSDSDGSGQCWLTQNQLGNTDVDNGAVRLNSSTFDFTAGPMIIAYDYYLNLTDASGADRLLVEVSSNGAAGPWTQVALHTSSGGLSWRHHEIRQSDLNAAGVTNTANMMLRFTANDANPQSINESGLDAFKLIEIQCGGVTCTKGDVNGDGSINGDDVSLFVETMITGGTPGTVPFCASDMNNNGVLEPVADVNLFVTCLVDQVCP